MLNMYYLMINKLRLQSGHCDMNGRKNKIDELCKQ